MKLTCVGWTFRPVISRKARNCQGDAKFSSLPGAVPRKSDEAGLDHHTLWRGHELDVQRFVDDATVAGKERQRLADITRGGRDIKQQPRLARICTFGQVKSESAVIHRLRRIFEKIELRRSRDGMPPTVKVARRQARALQQWRCSDIVFLERRNREPGPEARYGRQTLCDRVLRHVPYPLEKLVPI